MKLKHSHTNKNNVKRKYGKLPHSRRGEFFSLCYLRFCFSCNFSSYITEGELVMRSPDEMLQYTVHHRTNAHPTLRAPHRYQPDVDTAQQPRKKTTVVNVGSIYI